MLHHNHSLLALYNLNCSIICGRRANRRCTSVLACGVSGMISLSSHWGRRMMKLNERDREGGRSCCGPATWPLFSTYFSRLLCDAKAARNRSRREPSVGCRQACKVLCLLDWPNQHSQKNSDDGHARPAASFDRCVCKLRSALEFLLPLLGNSSVSILI